MDNDKTPNEEIVKNEEAEKSLSLPTPKPVIEVPLPEEIKVAQIPSPTSMLQTPQTQPLISPDPPISSVNLLLQWLMYAFYGLSLLAFIYLISSTVYYYLNGKDSDNYGSLALYAVVSVVILVGIAVVCNSLYQKNEPRPKKGPAAVIMIIHAVIFALFAIGAVIEAIFVIVSYALSGNGESSAAWAGVISGILVSVLYSATFVRTINPPNLKWINKSYMWGMIGITILLSVLAIIGPTTRSLKGKNDVLIQNNIGSIVSEIENKTTTDGVLPSSLSSLKLSGDALKIATNNLVTYLPNSLQNSDQNNYYYELCADFKYASPGYTSSMGKNQNADNSSNYMTYPDTYVHPSGHYCYLISILNSGISPVYNSTSSTTTN